MRVYHGLGRVSQADQNADDVTYYRPSPILKNRARFFFLLCKAVSAGFPPPGRHALPQVVRIDKFLVSDVNMLSWPA